MLQVIALKSPGQPDEMHAVQYIHWTVYDWRISVWSSILDDGPQGYDPSLPITSALLYKIRRFSRDLDIDRLQERMAEALENIWIVVRHCTDSRQSRATPLHIPQQLTELELRIVGKALLDRGMEGKTSKSRKLMFWALRHACVPYVQASFETAEEEGGEMH
jgi:hypothetical protein